MSSARVDDVTTPGFDKAVRAEASGNGSFVSDLGPDWAGPFGSNGGYLAAVLLGAATRHLNRSDLFVRVVNAHYLAATMSGPVVLDARVLRAGRRTATVAVELRQGERLTCMALVTYSASREGLTVSNPAPAVPAPDTVPEFDRDLLDNDPPTLGRVRLRPCFGAPLFAGAGEAVTGGWIDLTEDLEGQPYDAPRLVFLTDAWWPSVFSAATALLKVPTLSLTVHVRASAPASGPILARYETAAVCEGHVTESSWLWSRSGELLAEGHQMAVLAD